MGQGDQEDDEEDDKGNEQDGKGHDEGQERVACEKAWMIRGTGRGEKGSKQQDRKTNRMTTRIGGRRSRCENITTMLKRKRVRI